MAQVCTIEGDGENEGQNETEEMLQWLKENKLNETDITEKFKELQVTISELKEIELNDLQLNIYHYISLYIFYACIDI